MYIEVLRKEGLKSVTGFKLDWTEDSQSVYGQEDEFGDDLCILDSDYRVQSVYLMLFLVTIEQSSTGGEVFVDTWGLGVLLNILRRARQLLPPAEKFPAQSISRTKAGKSHSRAREAGRIGVSMTLFREVTLMIPF